jgi:hypothetical protein
MKEESIRLFLTFLLEVRDMTEETPKNSSDKKTWREFLFDRPITDSMIIIFTVVVAFVIVVSASSLVIVKFVDPSTDISAGSDALWSTLTSMVAALLGLIAGRASKGDKKPEE